MEYEAVIGLEVHVQLRTKSKMFTDAPYYFGAEPNTLTDPVVWALPGVLPVLNFEAIRKSIKAGMLLNCDIPEVAKWDRKNYFYPDSPKNYQLSQYDQPLCLNGGVEIELAGADRASMGAHRTVKLTRIHLEEDVGKLTHFANDSLVDFNRAGTPLIEIVSEPDLFSADEAFAYLCSLRDSLVFADISDCDMEKGQMRCDANISVRPKGEHKLGVKVEIKNMNSMSSVKAGIEYEIRRQTDAILKGQKIVQETRRWDAELGITQSMRGKENAHDYRYFPDPDLMPVMISQELKASIRKELPALPFDLQRKYMQDYGLPYSCTSVLCHERELAEYFEECVKHTKNAHAAANYIVNDILRELGALSASGERRAAVSQSGISAKNLAGLVNEIDAGVISKQMAKDVFAEMFKSGRSAAAIIEEKGLRQNSDSGEIESFCLEALKGNQKAIDEFKAGNVKAINALVGPVMKLSKGKANPAMVLETLKKLIK